MLLPLRVRVDLKVTVIKDVLYIPYIPGLKRHDQMQSRVKLSTCQERKGDILSSSSSSYFGCTDSFNSLTPPVPIGHRCWPVC